jgi:hypothetical protein
MKKHILLLFLLLPLISLAQKEDLSVTISKLKKIMQKESQYLLRGSSYDWYFRGHWGDKGYVENPFNRKYEKEVLEFLEGYLYDSLYNVQKVACDLIYSLGITSKNRRIRRRALNDLLDMAVIMPSTWYDILRFDLKDFDRRAKRRLKVLLGNEKTEYEKRVLFEYEKRRRLNDKYFRQKVKRISERNSLPEEYVIDSLILHWYVCFDCLNVSNDEFYLLPGWLYMYDFKKELERMLESPKYKYLRFPIKLSLARLGEREYEEQILRNEKNWKWVFYINTQSAYAWLVDYMNRTDETVPCDWDDTGFAPLSQVIYYSITRRIKNFPSEYRIKVPIKGSHCGFTKGELEKFEKGKIWLEQHKGHYKLDK